MKQENLLGHELETRNSGPVVCLGMAFENDDARRSHFTELLREKLKDPEFRSIEGFPIGTDEAIIELSDPPFYTACPNPWLNDFVELWESQKDESDEKYHREPFVADVSEGKNDPIYNAHSYHTKVPHKAIMRYILHYTNPGDIIFDGFCGTGMTGVAAKMCGDRDSVESLGYQVDVNGNIFESTIAASGTNEWKEISKLGARNAILNDISSAASFISHKFNKPVAADSFFHEANRILDDVKNECAWMYETAHPYSGKKGKINFIIWSDVFFCSGCSSEIVFWDVASDPNEGKVKDDFCCQNCGINLKKKGLERATVSIFDSAISEAKTQAKQVPVIINYSVDGLKGRFEKKPDTDDLSLIERINFETNEYWFPSERMKLGKETRRNDPIGITHTHHFYSKRNLLTMSAFRDRIFKSINKHPHLGMWFTSSHVWGTRLNRLLVSNYYKKRGGVIGQTLQGTLYISSIAVETNLLERFKLRIKSVPYSSNLNGNITSTGSSTQLSIPSNSLDYVFIDPPFGSNITYSELNTLWEKWLKVETNIEKEAIEDSCQKKTLNDYRRLMLSCFKEAYRVLKPGRWITIEFSNTKASVWNSIQSALAEAGFVVSSVSALEKNHKGFRAVTTATAVKQDLVISAYKPSLHVVDDIELNQGAGECVWGFIRSHLEYLLVVKLQGDELVKVSERDPRILFDQVVSFYIRNGYQVPISSQQFQQGLVERFVERDGMFFLSEQVAEYDKKRAFSGKIKQISIFVDDEASAIEWMRQELQSKPKVYSEIHPLFLNELSGWKKNELELELSTLLEQNFIKYDGTDEVPSQIHTYLSTNYKDMRRLDKDDPKLVAKAKDRWYVPDSNKASDLEKVRLRALLKEFNTYKDAKKKVKQPRAEALRAGFNTAWEAQDFQTILDVSAKIPTEVLQEDEKLLMFYDNALTLTSSENDEW